MSRNTDEKNRRGENTQRMRRRSRNAEEEAGRTQRRIITDEHK